VTRARSRRLATISSGIMQVLRRRRTLEHIRASRSNPNRLMQ